MAIRPYIFTTETRFLFGFLLRCKIAIAFSRIKEGASYGEKRPIICVSIEENASCQSYYIDSGCLRKVLEAQIWFQTNY